VALPSISSKRPVFSRRLLRWFSRHRRDLPWRRTRDPYRIWVAEVMLQQTRAATAGPYFERFVARFPDLRSLAEADLDEVLKIWEGLGYYRRARHLKRAAEQLVAAGATQLPDDYQRLLALPGVGRYTAGAVMSLAFNRPYPIQDGNVRRVLCRVWAVGRDPRRADVQAWLWHAAEQLIPRCRAGRFNEALMELGATVCTDRAARCTVCPLSELCDGHRRGDVYAYPHRSRAAPLPHFDVVAGIVRRGSRLLVAQRPATSMLGGLWEFPGGKVEAGESLERALHRELGEELGITVRVERPFVRVEHAYTHFRITLHSFFCRHRRGRTRALGCAAYRWLTLGELGELAFPKADRVIIAALQREASGR
jgi:A/G-specific adenine glycosylase